jgi:hypothetical protein
LLMIGIALGVVILAALWMLAPSSDKAPAAEPVGRSDGAIPLTLPPPDASSEAATTP